MTRSIFRPHFFLTAVASLLILAACEKKDEKNPGSATTTPPPAQAQIPTEPVATSPQALVQQFQADATATNAKYPRLTPFKITGVVAGFGIDTLKIKDEDKPELLTVAATFAESDQAKVKTMQRGDKITVIGKLNMYNSLDKTVELISCKFAQ